MRETIRDMMTMKNILLFAWRKICEIHTNTVKSYPKNISLFIIDEAQAQGPRPRVRR